MPVNFFRLCLIFSLSAFIRSFGVEGCDNVITIRDYERYAYETLPLGLREYLRGGTGEEETLKDNPKDFSKFKVLPRYLRDVSNATTRVTILGREFSAPIGIAPSGLHKRWHPEGELATVRASEQLGTIMIVSAASSTFFEELAEAAPNAEKWLQMFIFRSKEIVMQVVREAEELGFKALVVTADMPVSSLRYHNIRTKHKDVHKMVNWIKFQNLTADPNATKRDSITWEDLEAVVKGTKLPVFVKGILTGEDAKLAKAHGARGVIISNHGGRQIDGGISSIEALHIIGQEHPELLQDDSFDIYLDSGVRTGVDAFRAIALGAKFVFVGRPPMWGLVHSGQQGVENVMKLLQNEFQTVMQQAGCDHVSCIFNTPRRVKYYP